ncbi:MAG: hypothetical protein RL328_676 [Acidobacteriota bacterium]|jgi:hypothetical protein
MPAPLEIRVMSIGAEDWTPVNVPFDCSSMAIKNNSETAGLRLRTDAQDPLTEDVLGAGREQTFAVPFHRYRFLVGTQPLWLQAQSGTAAVVLKFLA